MSHQNGFVSTIPNGIVLDNIPFLDLVIDERQAFDGARIVLKTIRRDWEADDIKFTVFTDGYTNKLIACVHKDDVETRRDVVLVRVYGPGTDQMINREQERKSMIVFNRIGCAAPLYCRFLNGIAYGYSPGVVVNTNLVHQPNVRSLIARMMAQMHTVDPDFVTDFIDDGSRFSRQPCIFKVLTNWVELIPTFDDDTNRTRFAETFKSKVHLLDEIEAVRKELESLGSPVVLCHNDLLFKNIIYDAQKQKITFIDFEYVAFNYQAFDIANHFCEFAGMEDVDYSLYPDREYQLEWLRIYLESYYERKGEAGKEVTEHDLEVLYVQVNKFVLASHLMWLLWALIQAKASSICYDYMDFAKTRLTEYYAKKDYCLSLTLPVSNHRL